MAAPLRAKLRRAVFYSIYFTKTAAFCQAMYARSPMRLLHCNDLSQIAPRRRRISPGVTEKGSRTAPLFSRFMEIVVCALLCIILRFVTACGTIRTSAAAAAAAIAAALPLFSSYDRVCDVPDDKGGDQDDDEDLPPGHFLSSVAAASASASLTVSATFSCFAGCFLFQMTIPAIAAAMSAAKIKQVHHHEPMR